MPAIDLRTNRYWALTNAQECAICAEALDLSAFPDGLVTEECEHSAQTCLECLERSIRTELEMGRVWKDVRCPQCEARLSYHGVQAFADGETKRRYEELMARHTAQQIEGFVWCAYGCGSGQIHAGEEDEPIVKCISCGKLTCFQHHCRWHWGLSCEEYEMLVVKASEDRMRKTTKRCPRCKTRIERNGGCSHMTCLICATEFCWDCGEVWGYHNPTCDEV